MDCWIPWENLRIALHAELMAFKIGLTTALKQGFTKLDIETDSTDVISCLENGLLLFNDIVNECRWLMKQMKVQKVHHAFREANKVAHMLAREGLKGNSNSRDTTFIFYAPYFVTNAIKSDYDGKTYVIRHLNKDVCHRLASFGNHNVLRDLLVVCNSQVENAHSGDATVTIM